MPVTRAIGTQKVKFILTSCHTHTVYCHVLQPIVKGSLVIFWWFNLQIENQDLNKEFKYSICAEREVDFPPFLLEKLVIKSRLLMMSMS